MTQIFHQVIAWYQKINLNKQIIIGKYTKPHLFLCSGVAMETYL